MFIAPSRFFGQQIHIHSDFSSFDIHANGDVLTDVKMATMQTMMVSTMASMLKQAMKEKVTSIHHVMKLPGP